MKEEVLIEEPSGPCHGFWLLREEECPYHEIRRCYGRTDTPIRIPYNILDYFSDSLLWVPVVVPDTRGRRPPTRRQGLYFYGPNIINQEGERGFSEICARWADLFTLGPDPLILTTSGLIYHAPSGEGDSLRYQSRRMRIDRERLVGVLRLLSEWGVQAESGEQYILHIGI